MKKQLLFIPLLVCLSFFIYILPAKADGPPPPPPGHSLDGNQTSPGGGTGCPIDRNQGILMAMTLCLAYAGFYLIKRGRNVEEKTR